MQTLRVIRTIQWIQSFFGEDTAGALFNEEILHKADEGDAQFLPQFITATHELAVASATLSQNPDAVKVLKAFDLEPLIDKAFVTNLALSASKDPGSVSSMLAMIIEPWKSMIACVGPLENLTTPEELRGRKNGQGVLSVVFNAKEKQIPTLTDLARVMALVQQSYTATTTTLGKTSCRHLQVLSVEVSPPACIDCKGDAEVVSQLRNFIIEAWYKLRNKGADELIENNQELLASFPIMDRLAAAENEGSLPTQQAEQLRKKILGGTLGMFVHGALITGIPQGENNSESSSTPAAAGV
jgi:hypothetical protein